MRLPVPDQLLPADQLGRVHFVGIGGAGLSAIARIMLERGIEVSGSDGTDSATLDSLRGLGATVHVGHDAAHVEDVDTLVVSTAVREDNPEVVSAQRRGLRVLPRSAGLASVMAGRRTVRRRRDARQDHHHLPAHLRPDRRGRRPDVRRGRGSRRQRHQRRRRHR